MSAFDSQALIPLLAPLVSLRGIGPERAALLSRACGGERVLDLLFHLPSTYVDRRDRRTIRQLVPGRIATVAVEVVRHEKPTASHRPWRVTVTDGTGFAEMVFFRPVGLERLRPKRKLLVSGKVELFQGRPVLTHPEFIVPAEQADRLPAIEPVWGLTGGLSPRAMTVAVAEAVERLPELPEWHEPSLVRRERWPRFAEAMRALHAPAEMPGDGPRRRLAYDELLAQQVALILVRGRVRARPGRPHVGDGSLRAKAVARFGHTLTPSQEQALAEIYADLAAPRRMLRLLQGDVGSGKTLVALIAMLCAVEAGAQAALMAPTEVLAKQHHRTLSRLSPEPVALLTGSVAGRARAILLRQLADGDVRMVVGTHALFQETVAYRDLGVAVIDEQHRFGVHERLSLGDKGALTDVLVMTATPIPRTVLLSQWGEMDVSRLTGKPAGRQPVRTTLHSLSTMSDVLDGIERQIERGAQVFWVCPLVSESEALDVAAARQRYAALRERFGGTVGLAHGQQPAEERDGALAAFARSDLRLLVATTVIEVGVDVPEASVMVIEHAERFGLAQLHQLRGRVGRGRVASFCLLLHADDLEEAGRRRLSVLRDTDDGFRIADEDFRARGGGDLLGTRQAGDPDWRIAHPVNDEALLHMARHDASLLFDRDPGLSSERGRAVRLLLRLFDRAHAMRLLLAG